MLSDQSTEPPMHTRGRQSIRLVSGGLRGTTHAHAGQTDIALTDYRDAWNHPCTRGADQQWVRIHPRKREPPMHTRGRRSARVLVSAVNGTTHAHAGQTFTPTAHAYSNENHPCTRGADPAGTVVEATDREPPMHTRGRRLLTRYNVRMSAKLYSVACIMQ